jgi:hypothetical protein
MSFITTYRHCNFSLTEYIGGVHRKERGPVRHLEGPVRHCYCAISQFYIWKTSLHQSNFEEGMMSFYFKIYIVGI